MVKLVFQVFRGLLNRSTTSERGTAKCEYVLMASILSTVIVASTNPLSTAIESEFSQFRNALNPIRAVRHTGFLTDHPMTREDLIRHDLMNSNGTLRNGSGTSPSIRDMFAQCTGGGSCGSTAYPGGSGTGAVRSSSVRPNDGSNPPPPPPEEGDAGDGDDENDDTSNSSTPVPTAAAGGDGGAVGNSKPK